MRKLVEAIITLAVTFVAFSALAAPPPTDSDIRRAIVSCYRASGPHSPTIQQMHDCAGFWITPRALLQCVMQVKCQAFGDSRADRGEFYATLQAAKLDVTSPKCLSARTSLPFQ
jgi:hypothetical protein